MTLTPRSAQLHQQIEKYIDDALSVLNESFATARQSTAFAEIYHLSLSAETVLRGLSRPKLRPKLAAARSIVLRVPVLVGMGQQSVATVELRRFVELTCWTVYFSDHPVEWRSLEENPGGFVQDTRSPISYCAHRELGYYLEDARELMSAEPSVLGVSAVDGIKQVSHDLNASVHAGQIAHATRIQTPHEEIHDPVLRRFAGVQRRVFANCCLLLAAYSKSQFDQLNAVARAHFDWLIGSTLRKQVRTGPFGLAR
jgi:hypothetical protein